MLLGRKELPGRPFETLTTADSTTDAVGVSATGAAGLVAGQVLNAVTGVTATGGVGSVTPTPKAVPSGVSASGAAGSLALKVDKTLTGVSGAGAVGALVAKIEVTSVTGVVCTGSIGSVIANPEGVPAGIAANGAAGTLRITIDYTAMAGVHGAGAVGSLIPLYTQAVTGVAGTGAAGSVLAATQIERYGTTFPGQRFMPGRGLLGRNAVSQTQIMRVESLYKGAAAEGFAGSLVSTISVDIHAESIGATGQVGTLIVNPKSIPSGVSATGQVGAVALTIDFTSLLGVAGAGQVGSVVKTIDVVGPGVQASGVAGTFYFLIDKGIPSVVGTGIAADISTGPGILGVQASGIGGSIVPEPSGVPLGVFGTGHAGSPHTAIAYGLLGVTAVGVAQTLGMGLIWPRGVTAFGQVGNITSFVYGFLPPRFPDTPIVSYPLSIRRIPRILQARYTNSGFGTQKLDGQNADSVQSIDLLWNTLSEDEMHTLEDFLTARGGSGRFLYAVPGIGLDAMFACAKWQWAYRAPNAWDLSATLDRKFDRR